MTTNRTQSGITLVELMVVIAIIATIATIAIPFYMSNLRESEFGAAHLNLSTLRVYLEDYRLERGNYNGLNGLTWTADGTSKTLGNALGDWTPDGDGGKYDYTAFVPAANTGTYHLLIEDQANGLWVRCEDRMTDCCDSGTAGATRLACP